MTPQPKPPQQNPLADPWVFLTVMIFIVVAGGVCLFGDELRTGRFFQALGPIAAILVVLLSNRSHQQKADQRDKKLDSVAKDVDTVKQQTNGGMLTQVRDAQREQMTDDPEYLDKLANKVAQKAVAMIQQQQLKPGQMTSSPLLDNKSKG